ncbi:hypothetical protein [Epibacterium ulvae]|uniref:hypothetical protein n=1 Tax=Epibacterium ulvae TaxID=1156985 RepID=UPI002492EE16|nr:hypothetical protein [Epibacterium ulvae]
MSILATIFAPLIAVGGALYIAKQVYPEQKEKDRQLQLRAEKRQAYRDFFQVTARLTSHLRGAFFERKNVDRRDEMFQKSEDLLPDLYVSLDVLGLKCQAHELNVISDYYEAIMRYRAQLRHELLDAPLAKAYQGDDVRNTGIANGQVQSARSNALVVARTESLAIEFSSAQRELKDYASLPVDA